MVPKVLYIATLYNTYTKQKKRKIKGLYWVPKVLYIATLYSTYTRALTFENLCLVSDMSTSHAPTPWCSAIT